MTVYEALYYSKCQIPLWWSELSESNLAGTNLMCMIEESFGYSRLLESYFDQQKSYVDLKKTDIEFEIGDKYYWNCHLEKRFCVLVG